MSKVKFVLNSNGVKELMKSDAIKKECRRYAEQICNNANGMCDGFVAEERSYPERSGYAVRPDTAEANARNLRENILLKSRGF